jgi:hypothetical protein
VSLWRREEMCILPKSPMSSSSNGTSSFCNNGMEHEVMSSRTIECMCNYQSKLDNISLVCRYTFMMQHVVAKGMCRDLRRNGRTNPRRSRVCLNHRAHLLELAWASPPSSGKFPKIFLFIKINMSHNVFLELLGLQ